MPPWRVPSAFAHSPIVQAEARAAVAYKAAARERRVKRLMMMMMMKKKKKKNDGGSGDGVGGGGVGVGDGGGSRRRGFAPPRARVAAAAARASAAAATANRTGPFFLFRGDIRPNSMIHSLGVRQEALRFYGPNRSGSARGDVIVDGPAPTYRDELASVGAVRAELV